MNSLLAGSVFIGRYFGINVRIHVTFLIFAGFRLLDSMGSGGLKFTAISMALLFLLILTHEFGHCLAARTVGGDAQEILMWPLGGLAFAHAPMTPRAQFVTVAGGPLVNVIWCIVIGIFVSATLGTASWIDWNPLGGSWDRRLFMAITTSTAELSPMMIDLIFYAVLMYNISYWLLLFNLLPIYPMDGGQLFMTMIWPAVGLRAATVTACRVGVGGAIVMGGLGFVPPQNWMLVVLAAFGAFTCYQRLQAIKYGQVLDERIATYDATGRYHRKRGFWSRLFGGQRRSAAGNTEPPKASSSANPNPGGWDTKVREEERLDSEVDRILKKVHERGIASLTYVEKQTLEMARRVRMDQEREYQGGGKS